MTDPTPTLVSSRGAQRRPIKLLILWHALTWEVVEGTLSAVACPTEECTSKVAATYGINEINGMTRVGSICCKCRMDGSHRRVARRGAGAPAAPAVAGARRRRTAANERGVRRLRLDAQGTLRMSTCHAAWPSASCAITLNFASNDGLFSRSIMSIISVSLLVRG